MIMLKIDIEKFNAARFKIIGRLEKQKSLTATRVAKYMQNTAQILAPKLTGELVNSIEVEKADNGGKKVVVKARGNRGFNYPKWVNQSPGYEVLQYDKSGSFIHPASGNRVIIPAGTNLIYGQSPSGWNWSGKARFFNKSAQMTRTRFKQMAVNDFRGVLSGLGVNVK